jgi:tetratricopeptide (TPR) repeat protein
MSEESLCHTSLQWPPIDTTTKPGVSMSSELEGKSARHRLAIFQSGANGKEPLGQATFFEGEDGKWVVQCSADTELNRQKVRELLESYNTREPVIDAEAPMPSGADIDRLIASIRQDGYEAEVIPLSDFEFSFQMSAADGVMVAKNKSLRDGMPENGALARRIFGAVSTGLTKPSEDLAAQVEELCQMAKFDDAAAAVQAADISLIALAPSKRLLLALAQLDVGGLIPSDRAHVLDVRVLLAEMFRDFVLAGNDAAALLAEDRDDISPEKVVALKMLVAVGSIKRGNKETGLSLLREIVSTRSPLSAAGRAWGWRNIALTLDRDDPEARRAHKLSADAFLEAGMKNEAGKSLMHMANLLLDVNPEEAVARLTEVLGVLSNEGIVDSYVRSTALHARANRFARLGRHEDAYRDAVEAVELRKGLLGDDEGLVSSLHLAAIEATHIGRSDCADAFTAEAERLTSDLGLAHFQLAERVQRLGNEYDAAEAAAIISDAESMGNLEIVAAVRVLQAVKDEGMSDFQRLEVLEELTRQVTNDRGARGMLKPARAAIYQLLVKQSQLGRAERWCRAAIDEDAFDGDAQQYLVHCLWGQEKWGDAAEFLRKQIALKGELSGLSYALGSSEFEAGALSNAVTTLTKLVNASGVDKSILSMAAELRERALLLGGVPLSPLQVAATGSLTRDEFEAALHDFASFVASDKRMRFWRRQKDGSHKWVPSPERLAQDFLHAFLKARFGQRVEVFEEVSAGAGRLDIYVKLDGGLAVILELKMCGPGYSSAYASSGEEQIIHYLENRQTHLGYLVVFDARVNLFCDDLLKGGCGAYTIIEKFVDVRNRVKST